jgi:hypothetical protein
MTAMRRKALGLFWLAVMLGLAIGCSGKSGDPKQEDKKGGEQDEGKAPHGGTLFAPGTKQHPYHLELKLEKDKPTYLYVLDSKVKNAVPITARAIELEIKGDKPQTIQFKADRQQGDSEGESSRFMAPAGKVPAELDLAKVEIHAAIKEKQYHFIVDKD